METLKVYRDPDDGAWIADIENAIPGDEWSGSYWTQSDALKAGCAELLRRAEA